MVPGQSPVLLFLSLRPDYTRKDIFPLCHKPHELVLSDRRTTIHPHRGISTAEKIVRHSTDRLLYNFCDVIRKRLRSGSAELRKSVMLWDMAFWSPNTTPALRKPGSWCCFYVREIKGLSVSFLSPPMSRAEGANPAKICLPKGCCSISLFLLRLAKPTVSVLHFKKTTRFTIMQRGV